MIDIHCHILPGIDDGPESQDMSLEMAEIAEKDGIRVIVATPHTLNGVYLNRSEEVISRVQDLQKAISGKGIRLRVYPGADNHLCPNMLERIKKGDAGTINNSGKFILLELPSQSIPNGVKDEIFRLKLAGVTPIITHPERNMVLDHDPEILYEFVNMGALIQITAMSLTGEFGELTRAASELMVKNRVAHIIATDAHSNRTRRPVLSLAVEYAADILGSYDEARQMVSERPDAILRGEMPDIPEPIRTRQRFRFFAKSKRR